MGCTTYADGETREPAHFSTAIGRHDRLVTVNDIQTHISQQVDAALPMMPDHLRAWVESHRIVPREITVFSDPDGRQPLDVWLVTDDTGHQDGSSNIAYDAAEGKFGQVMQMQNDVAWYLGSSDSFMMAVENI